MSEALRSDVNGPSQWAVLESSMDGMYDVAEYLTEYPEEGVLRYATTNDHKSARYVADRLQLLEDIRSWIFEPVNECLSPAEIVAKISEKLGWYEETQYPKAERGTHV